MIWMMGYLKLEDGEVAGFESEGLAMEAYKTGKGYEGCSSAECDV